MSENKPLVRPGYGCPLNVLQEGHQPQAVLSWRDTPITVRETMMLAVMNQLTDKPEWRRKVFDETIIKRWKNEIVNDHGPQFRREPLAGKAQGFTSEMFDFCIDELQEKAKMFEETGMVMVLDVEALVIKSDSIVEEELRLALISAVKPLEEVPNDDKFKDWHPGSDGKVLNLVHPSLFPLVYGRTKVRSHGEIGLKDCLIAAGSGEVAPQPDNEETVHSSTFYYARKSHLWSKKFQWLPCEIKFVGDEVKITSYINNLHPLRHEHLYSVIEKFIGKALPLWSCGIQRLDNGIGPRISIEKLGFEYVEDDKEGTLPGDMELEQNLPDDRHREKSEGSDEDIEDSDSEMDRSEDSELEDRLLCMPQPRAFRPTDPNEWPSDDFLRKKYAKEGLQVIIKLANIMLTPEKPRYGGGSWHVEGQLNEKICATALYYYDCENVTDSYLAFRGQIDTEDLHEMPGQGDYGYLEYLFDIEQHSDAMQDRGRVLTRQGRLLSFPNVFQHRVAPFSLVDPSKPGHRKILALFLVDPGERIISTANVPPQQKDWWAETLRDTGALSVLPTELFEAVIDEVVDPMDLEEAKELRLELMDERKGLQETFGNDLNTFNFCEH